MAESNRVKFQLVNVDVSALTANYQPISVLGLSDAAISFKFYNSSTNLILLSTNGVDDHDFVPPGGTFIFDAEANSSGWGNGAGGHKNLPEGTLWQAKTSSNTDRLLLVAYY